MNALVRIDEPNSVVATTQILREIRTHGTRPPARSVFGVRRGDPDEDIVERRPGDLEVVIRVRDIRAASRSCGSPRQRTSWKFPWSLISSMPSSPSRASHPGLGPQPDRVVAVGRLDLVERAVEDLSALEDHEDPVAQPLGDRHVVRREDHRGPRLLEVEHRVLEDLGVDRVEPGERLVEDRAARAGSAPTR